MRLTHTYSGLAWLLDEDESPVRLERILGSFHLHRVDGRGVIVSGEDPTKRWFIGPREIDDLKEA